MKVGAIPVTLLMATSLTVGITQGLATERIYDDPGGQIGEYLAKFRAIRISGERVVIDGTCASACTLVLGTIPRPFQYDLISFLTIVARQNIEAARLVRLYIVASLDGCRVFDW
jgi:hypothetical protein